MINILHTGDWHISTVASRLGRTNPNINKRRLQILNYVIDVGIQKKCNFYVIGGDIFDIARPYPQDYHDFYTILNKIPDYAIVIIIPGNHDFITNQGCAIKGYYASNVMYSLELHVYNDLTHQVSFIIAPWGTQLSTIKSVLGNATFPAFLILHGGVKDEEHHYVEVEGETGNFHLADLLQLPVKGVLLSHYHNQKQLGANVWYAGSPDNVHGFGEEKDNKGFLIWTVNDDGSFIVTPYSTNDLVNEYFTFTPQEFLKTPATMAEYIRIKGTVTEQERIDIIEKLKLYSCIDYKLDIKVEYKSKRVFLLDGDNETEILTNYLKHKQLSNINELLKLDKEIK